MKAAEDKYDKMEDPMPSTLAPRLLLSFPVLFPPPPTFSISVDFPPFLPIFVYSSWCELHYGYLVAYFTVH